MNQQFKIGRKIYNLNFSTFSLIKYQQYFKQNLLDDFDYYIKNIVKYIEAKTISIKVLDKIIIFSRRLFWICYISNLENKYIDYKYFWKRKYKKNNWIYSFLIIAMQNFIGDENVHEVLPNIEETLDKKQTGNMNNILLFCLEIGLTLNDLREIPFPDIIKILVSKVEMNSNTDKVKEATQEDIDGFCR